MGTVSPVTRLRHQAGSGRPGPRCHGWRCRRPSSDLFPTRRLSTKVFLPTSPNCPTPRLSCDPPTPYPIVFPAILPTRCLSRLHVFMNSRRPTQPRSFTHPRRLLRIQKNVQQREEVLKSLRSTKHRQELHGDDISLPNQPIVFQKGGDEEEEKRRADIFAL